MNVLEQTDIEQVISPTSELGEALRKARDGAPVSLICDGVRYLVFPENGFRTLCTALESEASRRHLESAMRDLKDQKIVELDRRHLERGRAIAEKLRLEKQR